MTAVSKVVLLYQHYKLSQQKSLQIVNQEMLLNHQTLTRSFHQPYDYGSSSDLHSNLMGIIWSPCANLSIFLIIFSFRKQFVWLHMFFFTIAIFITLISSVPLFLQTGFVAPQSKIIFQKHSTLTISIHEMVGILCCSFLFFTSLLGVMTKSLNIMGAKYTTILLLRKIHKYCGYAVLLLCKSNIYIIKKNPTKWIIIDLFFLLAYILMKLYMPRLEQKNITPKYKKQVSYVKSVKELNQNKSYVIFANKIYDVEPLRNNHPAGFQIFDVLKNKQVDRYIYGSCVPDELPEIPQWSHSYKIFSLMKDPVAVINITQTFDGFDYPQVEVNIPKPKLLSEKGSIYQINLTKKEGSFTFLKYQNINQLGRYYGLTLNDNVTRLYTTVNFLVKQNTDFMERHLQFYREWARQQTLVQEQQQIQKDKYDLNLRRYTAESPKIQRQKQQQYYNKNNNAKIARIHQNPDVLVEQQKIPQKNVSKNEHYIPFMFKSYPGGKFSQTIVKGPVNKLLLSCSKGEGLQLGHTEPGKIIMVAGGTGIYPFSDFIDLLYKEQLMIHNPSLRAQILQLSPVLKSNPFKNFSFELLAACRHIEDMHIITLEQLLYLAEKGRLNITFKFKQTPHRRVRQGHNISLTTQSFQKILDNRLQKGGVSRVWICGPPGMNMMVSKFLRDVYHDPDMYLIV